ncbi:hypothetical protein D3C81_1465280 [compost metagenome]
MRDEIAAPLLQTLLYRRPVGQLVKLQRHRQLLCQALHLIDEQSPLFFQIGRALQGGIAERQLGQRIGIGLGIRRQGEYGGTQWHGQQRAQQ